LAQLNYMGEEPPFEYRPDLAEQLQPVLKRMLQTMLDWAREQPGFRP
jgi:N-formylglutamate amidohydrolase